MHHEHLGNGVFTTFVVKPFGVRAVWGAPLLENHLLRLCLNAQRINLCGRTTEELRMFFDTTINKLLMALDVIPLRGSGVPLRCRVKVIAEGIYVDTAPYREPWPAGGEITASFFQGERPLPEIKSLSCVLSFAARSAANSQGAQEALLVGYDNLVREGAWSNLFWLDRRSRLCTTNKQILPGITRAQVVREFKVAEQAITLCELIDEAQELFITQSTTGVTAINRLLIDGQLLNRTTARATEVQRLFEDSLPLYTFPIDELRPSREWIVKQLVATISGHDRSHDSSGANEPNAANRGIEPDPRLV